MGDTFFGQWQFRGARVVRAVVSKLRPSRGRLIFGGGSAGARGAMVLLDEVAKLPMKATLAGILLTYLIL